MIGLLRPLSVLVTLALLSLAGCATYKPISLETVPDLGGIDTARGPAPAYRDAITAAPVSGGKDGSIFSIPHPSNAEFQKSLERTLANAKLSTNAGRRFVSSTTPVAQLGAANLFPFADGYGVYSGRCVEENPSVFDSAWASTSGNAFLFVDRGANATMTVRQPALPVRVANGKRTSSPQNGQWNWVGGANVRAKLVVPSTSDCSASPDIVNGITTDTASGLQSYPTGQTYTGSLSSTSNYTDGWLGFVTRKAPGTTGQTWANRYFDPGLPWGTWQVCADNGLTGTSARRAFLTVVNGDRDGTANYAVLDLSASPQTATCGPTSSAWPAPSATPTVVP